MRKIRNRVLACAGIVAVLAASFVPAFAAEIQVGMAGPLTGQNASMGEQMRHGAEQAVADLNAAGGVNGTRLNLTKADDACDPKQAVAVASQLASRGAVMVAGHYCSGSSIPAAPIYAEEGVLQISPASTNPQLTEQGLQTTFRVCGRDDQQGGAAASYIAGHFKGQKIAVLQDKTAYGKGIADEVVAGLKKAGIEPVLYEAYTTGERDFNALVSRLKQAGAALVYIGGAHTETGLIVRQLRAQGSRAVVMGGDSLMTTEFNSITGKDGDGVLMTFGPDPRNRPEAAALVEKFRKQGYEPEGYTLYTYAAFQAWAQAAMAAKSVEASKVADAMRAGTFQTVLGPLGFDAKGDVKAPTYVVYQWQGGKFAELKD